MFNHTSDWGNTNYSLNEKLFHTQPPPTPPPHTYTKTCTGKDVEQGDFPTLPMGMKIDMISLENQLGIT